MGGIKHAAHNKVLAASGLAGRVSYVFVTYAMLWRSVASLASTK